MPFVPVASACIGFYMYLVLRPKFKVKTFNPSEIVLAEVKKMGKLRGREALMAVILVCLVAAWVILGEHSGLGRPYPVRGHGHVPGPDHHLERRPVRGGL